MSTLTTGEEFGARGGGDGTEEIPEIVPIAAVVTVSDDGGEDDGDNEPSPMSPPFPANTRPIECRQYKTGTCMESDSCSTTRHPHRIFPSTPLNWETHHIQRLRFVCHPFNMPQGLSCSRIVCQWLFSDESFQLGSQCQNTREDESEGCTQDLRELALGATAAAGQQKTVTSVRQHLQEDDFLRLLVSFVANYNLETDNINVLKNAVSSDELVNKADAKPCLIHRRALLTWLDVCNLCTNGKFCESRLDDLVVDVINAASYETDCLVTLKIRESTARYITVCGQIVTLQSDVEVCSANGDPIVQVTTSTQNTVFTRHPDPEEILPQMASQALAVAKDSPFGSLYYKTAHQVFVHTVCSPGGRMEQVCVYLVRCHIARDTLGRMTECPIANPLKRSYILYEKIPCVNLYYENVISTLYQAIKAVLLMSRNKN